MYALALHVGIPPGEMKAWSGVVAACTRRFRGQDSVGPPLLGTSGFPEGDNISVVAMLLVDAALHAFEARETPCVAVSIYSDDWKCTAEESSQVLSALTAVDRFASLWDWAVDPSKSTAWATCPKARKILREAYLPIVLSSRDLGGQASYS